MRPHAHHPLPDMLGDHAADYTIRFSFHFYILLYT